jgi:hypothetical protein
MKRIFFYSLLIAGTVTTVTSCDKKDYIIGGEPHDADMFKQTLSYDAIKTMPQYDTFIQLIDAGGLKDKLNSSNTTYFMPTDYGILAYLQARTAVVQKVNQYAKFGLDSLLYYISTNKNGTRDSLLMYQVAQPLWYSGLTEAGQKFKTELPGDTAVVSFEVTTNPQQGYTPTVSTPPRLQYYTHMWKPYGPINDANQAKNIPNTVGVRTLNKSSFMATKNGVLNGLDPSHILFFYGTKK